MQQVDERKLRSRIALIAESNAAVQKEKVEWRRFRRARAFNRRRSTGSRSIARSLAVLTKKQRFTAKNKSACFRVKCTTNSMAIDDQSKAEITQTKGFVVCLMPKAKNKYCGRKRLRFTAAGCAPPIERM